MRKSQKLIFTCLLLAVIVAFSVVPTLSWLSATTDPVVNTFAGGAISITLDEALVDTSGKALTGDNAQRVTSNSYKYLAGSVLDKDPTPTVLKGSEECYVFLCVENELNDKFTMNYDTSVWLEVAQQNNKTVYVYSTTVNALDSETDIALAPIFTSITVSEDLTQEDVSLLGEKTVSVTAYAVQTSSLSSQTAIDLAVAEFLTDAAASNYPTVQ